MFCRYCGAEIAENYNFCAECGQKISSQESNNKNLTPTHNLTLEEYGKESPKYLTLIGESGVNIKVCEK